MKKEDAKKEFGSFKDCLKELFPDGWDVEPSSRLEELRLCWNKAVAECFEYCCEYGDMEGAYYSAYEIFHEDQVPEE